MDTTELNALSASLEANLKGSLYPRTNLRQNLIAVIHAFAPAITAAQTLHTFTPDPLSFTEKAQQTLLLQQLCVTGLAAVTGTGIVAGVLYLLLGNRGNVATADPITKDTSSPSTGVVPGGTINEMVKKNAKEGTYTY